MKKLLSLMLAVIMLMSMTVAASAEVESVAIGVTSAQGATGDTVTVDVTISENHYMVNGMIKIYYDDTALELVPESAEVLASYNTEILGQGAYCLIASPMAGRVNFAYVTMSDTGKAQGGTLFSLTFKILDGAKRTNTVKVVVPDLNANATGAKDDDYPDVTLTNGVITATDKVVKGDLNGDGIANIADATLLFRAANGRITLTPEQKAIADLNGDGVENIADATMLFRYANGRLASL